MAKVGVPLTDQQTLFVHEYLVDRNATQAAIRAGYSKANAARVGSRLTGEPNVKAAINKHIQKMAKKIDITAEKVLQEIAKCAFVNIKDFHTDTGLVANPKDLDDSVAATVIEVSERTIGSGDEPITEYRYKLANKLDALEKLGKHLKLFTDKVETEVTHKMSLKELMERSAEDE